MPIKFLAPLLELALFNIGIYLSIQGCAFRKSKKVKKLKIRKKIKMTIFRLPRFVHEPFWLYLFRFNDYRAQYVHFTYNKWEI